MRRLLLLLGLILALAGCGGDQESTTVTVTNTETQTRTETVEAEPVLTVKTSDVALKGPTFQMPSKNIGCTEGEGVLVCDILSGLNPEPSQPCELDWTGIELEAAGPASARCAGDTSFDQAAPVLAYGRTWKNDTFTCSSATSGLTCENGEGHGFSLARASWDTS